MTKNTLFVPIHVDGLFVEKSIDSIGASADFSRLPHIAADADGNVYDSNASHPWLTETISDEPFSNETATLEAGVHLHWAMPDMLTRARHPVDKATNQKNRGELEFPALPNRWLVQRRASGAVQGGWIIESDYIWPYDHRWGEIHKSEFDKELGDKSNEIWNALLKSGWTKGNGEKAFVSTVENRKSNYIGPEQSDRAKVLKTIEKLSLEARGQQHRLSSYPYNNETADGFSRPDNPPFRRVGRVRRFGQKWEVTGTAEYMGPKTTGPLTAVGWGEPSFAAFYPNCRSIFGFHDDIHAGVQSYCYDVYGWYADPKSDPLADAPDDPKKFGVWLNNELKWSVPVPSGEAPKQIVCFGRVAGKNFVPQSSGDLHGKPALKSLGEK